MPSKPNQKICSCGLNMESWQNLCYTCYRLQDTNKAEAKDRYILKQVLVKCASNQLTNSNPNEVIEYAKQLEKAFMNWV